MADKNIDGVLYLEVDEDITSAIDKLNQTESDSVRLVVPKRSTMMQSVINLKLLKKAADEAKKELVLVTGDDITVNLASRLGLPVADNIKSEAEVPEKTEPEPDTEAEVLEEEAPPPATVEPEPEPVAGKKEVAKPAAAAATAAGKPAKKGLKVPDFNQMQKRLMIAGGIIGVVLLLFGLNFFIKSATITIFAKGTQVPTDFNFGIDAETDDSDLEEAVLGGEAVSNNKELVGTYQATGQKDVGTKASGDVTVTNYCYNPGTLAAGTVFTSSGKRFLSTQAVAVPDANFAAGNCQAKTVKVPVQADSNGDSYNLAPATYAVGSLPSSGATYVRGQGEQMSGGTSKVIAVVTQADIDKARAELLEKDKQTAQEELEEKLDDDQLAIGASFKQEVAGSSANPALDQEATSFSMNVQVAYTALAVKRDDMEKLIKQEVMNDIGDQNEVYDTGLDNAVISQEPNGLYNFNSQVYAGAKLDQQKIITDIKGKKFGEAIDIISKRPGVDKAEISLSPFWVARLPRIDSHIKVEIKVTPAD